MPTNVTTHREHLDVPISWWLLGLGFAGTVVVAVGAYTNWWFAGASALLSLLVIGGVFLGYGRVQVAVDERGVLAGRSLVEWPWVADVQELDKEQMRAELGPGSSARAFLLTRPYVAGGVKVLLDDPADPHPWWIVSTRHARRMAQAARAQMAQGGRA